MLRITRLLNLDSLQTPQLPGTRVTGGRAPGQHQVTPGTRRPVLPTALALLRAQILGARRPLRLSTAGSQGDRLVGGRDTEPHPPAGWHGPTPQGEQSLNNKQPFRVGGAWGTAQCGFDQLVLRDGAELR